MPVGELPNCLPCLPGMRGQTERETAGKELVTTDRPDEIAALAAVIANIGSPSNLIVRPFRALRLVVRSLPFE